MAVLNTYSPPDLKIEPVEAPPAPTNGVNVLSIYAPPFDLVSDMLATLAWADAAPLRRTFPDHPFLTVGEQVPLAVWFSRVRWIRHGEPFNRQQLGNRHSILYHEMTIAAPLRQKDPFALVLAIYADGDLTVSIGRAYGMPKETVPLQWSAEREKLRITLGPPGKTIVVSAQRLFPLPGTLVNHFWPTLWPVDFPAGPPLRPTFQVPTMLEVARLDERVLDLQTPWLPRRPYLSPWAIYVPKARMIIPEPEQQAESGVTQ